MLNVTALYIQLGAGIANRVPCNQSQTYLPVAEAAWDWFFSIGVVNSENYVVDGLNIATCQPTGDVYSYNQGVILGAAAELYGATGNDTYLDLAENIANTVAQPNSEIASGNSIVQDGCDKSQSCSGDAEGFKGPFIKGLRQLTVARNNTQWVDFIETNAQSIWNNDLDFTDDNCVVGQYWAGPVKSPDSISQGNALDAILGAAIVSS